jgi:hypothetical protein
MISSHLPYNQEIDEFTPLMNSIGIFSSGGENRINFKNFLTIISSGDDLNINHKSKYGCKTI